MRWLVKSEHARAARLAAADRFSALTPREMLRVVRAGRLVRLPRDTMVVREEQPSGGVWIVLTGRLRVLWHDEEIREVTTGDMIGEISVVEGRPHSASVVALEDSEAVHLYPAEVRALADAIPAFALALVDTAYERRDGDVAAGRRTPRREPGANPDKSFGQTS